MAYFVLWVAHLIRSHGVYKLNLTMISLVGLAKKYSVWYYATVQVRIVSSRNKDVRGIVTLKSQ